MPPGITSIEQAMAGYVASHGSVAAIAWDNQNTVTYCNKAFADMLQIDFAAIGRSVFDFLRFPDYPECKLGTLSGPIQAPVSLKTAQGEYRCDSTVFPLDSGHIAFCDRPVLLQSDIVDKMAKMNLELTNLTWEGQKKTRRIEKINEQLQREIAERKRAEEKLQSSQMRYYALMEQSNEALALVDIETQEIVEVNRRHKELFGYSLPEDAPLYANKIVVDSGNYLERLYNVTLKQQSVIPTEMRKFRHKNGRDIYAERAGTVIQIDGKAYLLISCRDMTEERRRQAEMSRDVETASRVQKELLPEVPESPFVNVRTLYRPTRMVSGDSYYLDWHNNLLRGFLIDVSGHSIATALQTASVNVLLREIADSQLTLLEQMELLNERVSRYFTEDSYAALLGFELDISARELRYVGAGITQFHANGKKIETPGNYVGMFNNAQFGTGFITFSEGDTFHFLTDGFTDVLAQPENEGLLSADGKDFEGDVGALERLMESGKLRDDATGICLKVTGVL